MRRPEANKLVLLLFGGVLLLIAGDYIRATLTDPSLRPPKIEKSPYETDFKEGGLAPDFTLLDREGRGRRLSQYAGKEVLLSFVSDDAKSRAVMRYVASLAERRRKLGKPAPVFVTVADFGPAREQAFLRETGLRQIVLYEAKDGPVARQYKAEARPRCFQLAGRLGVVVIGASPGEAPLFEVGNEVLMGWRMRSPALRDSGFSAPEPADLKRFDTSKPAGEPHPAAGPSRS